MRSRAPFPRHLQIWLSWNPCLCRRIISLAPCLKPFVNSEKTNWIIWLLIVKLVKTARLSVKSLHAAHPVGFDNQCKLMVLFLFKSFGSWLPTRLLQVTNWAWSAFMLPILFQVINNCYLKGRSCNGVFIVWSTSTWWKNQRLDFHFSQFHVENRFTCGQPLIMSTYDHTQPTISHITTFKSMTQDL